MKISQLIVIMTILLVFMTACIISPIQGVNEKGNSTCNSCVFYPLCNGLSCRFDDLCNKYHDTTLHKIRMQYK